MSKPKQFKYMSATYDISFEETEANKDGNQYFGQIKFSKMKIVIKPDLAPYQERWTLLHEIVHIINTSAGDSLTEGQTDFLAAGLMETFRQNPWLYDYIKQEK